MTSAEISEEATNEKEKEKFFLNIFCIDLKL